MEGARGQRPALKNQAQRFPSCGVNMHGLDYLNVLSLDVAAPREFLKTGLALARNARHGAHRH
jgi:catechol 2,3-dioxygenase